MKITIVLGPFHPMPPAGFGAVEKVWHDLARVFASRGHEVTLIGKGPEPGEAQRDGVHTLSLRGFPASASIVRNLWRDLRYAVMVVPRIPASDIVVTNSFWTPVVAAFLRRAPGRLVVHVARFPKRQMALYRHAALVQAVSTVVAKEIVRQTPSLAGKVRVLPNPIDASLLLPPPQPRRYDGECIVLYVGRVHPEKGLGLLVRAMRELGRTRPVRLRIVGPSEIEAGGGGPAYLRSLRDAAGDAAVEFVGAVRDRAALALEYTRAHCFCYPSLAERGEASPVAPLEAMATACPVVVSDLECFRDYLDPEDTGVVFDHRPAHAASLLAGAIGRILGDPGYARRLGERAALRARDFDVAAIGERYLAMFGEALAAGARP